MCVWNRYKTTAPRYRYTNHPLTIPYLRPRQPSPCTSQLLHVSSTSDVMSTLSRGVSETWGDWRGWWTWSEAELDSRSTSKCAQMPVTYLHSSSYNVAPPAISISIKLPCWYLHSSTCHYTPLSNLVVFECIFERCLNPRKKAFESWLPGNLNISCHTFDSQILHPSIISITPSKPPPFPVVKAIFKHALNPTECRNHAYPSTHTAILYNHVDVQV